MNIQKLIDFLEDKKNTYGNNTNVTVNIAGELLIVNPNTNGKFEAVSLEVISGRVTNLN